MRTIAFDEVSTIRMVAGNENKITFVIWDGYLMEWVGIGWVRERKATAQDRRRYPRVVARKGGVR
jgi:hypothetical protein